MDTRAVVEDNLDGMLLLLARGATAGSVARSFGMSHTTLVQRLTDVAPKAYADALRARPYLRDDTHGTRGRYGRGCRCLRCCDGARAREQQRGPRTDKVQRKVDYKVRNDATRKAATRLREPWTETDLELVLERGADGRWMRPAGEVAFLLGRSYRSVVAKRSRTLVRGVESS